MRRGGRLGLALANRERSIERQQAQFATSRKLARVENEFGGKLARAKSQRLEWAAAVGGSAITSGIEEFAGISLESLARLKAGKFAKYVPLMGMAAEFIGSGLTADLAGKAASPAKLMASQALTNIGRGARMRATIGFADDIVGKIFG